MIVAAAKKAEEHKGWLRLAAPLSNVRHILEITGIDAHLGLYDTVEQAAAHREDSSTPDVPNEPDTIPPFDDARSAI